MALNTAARQAKVARLQRVFREERGNFKPFYQKICTVVPSTGFDEEYGMLGAAPAVREWLGDRKFHTIRSADFTIKNKDWEVSEVVPKTALDDDRVGLYEPVMRRLARRAMSHPDKLVLNDLLPSANAQLCFDGQYFFDTDHGWGDSGAQDNDLTKSIVDAAAPTVEELSAALSTMIQAMLSFKDDQGELLHDEVIMDLDAGMQLMLVVPLGLGTTGQGCLQPFNGNSIMARRQSRHLALKWGHQTPFRRTIDLGTEKSPNKVTLVFEPGVKYKFSAKEVELLGRDLGTGMLVFADEDPKARYVDCEELDNDADSDAEPEPEGSDEEAIVVEDDADLEE